MLPALPTRVPEERDFGKKKLLSFYGDGGNFFQKTCVKQGSHNSTKRKPMKPSQQSHVRPTPVNRCRLPSFQIFLSEFLRFSTANSKRNAFRDHSVSHLQHSGPCLCELGLACHRSMMPHHAAKRKPLRQGTHGNSL